MVDTRTMTIVKVEGRGNKKKTIGVILTGRNSLHFILDCQYKHLVQINEYK